MLRRPLLAAAPLLALLAACNGLTGVNGLGIEGGPTGNGAGSGGRSGTGGGTDVASSTGAMGHGGAGTSSGITASSAGATGGPGATTSTGGMAGPAGTGGSGNLGDPEPPDMVGMTAAHNAARAAVMPVATPPLPSMTWSSTVAASAQAFVANCVFADTGPPYGSNAFAGTGEYTPADVVAAWVSEDASYSYASNTCDVGAECGHYTQVVWRDSTELGCGMATCMINNPFGGNGPWQLWVCNYNPPGNYVGMKPY